MTRCHIALGGNLGDVPAAFAAALDRLTGPDLRVTVVSGHLVTPPMGADAGGSFVNAAAVLETTLGPYELLDRLLVTEAALGRVRSLHWGPRAIDLDLIFYGDLVVETPRLTVPHPAAWLRRFVLDPLAEIDPEAHHPVTGETVAALRSRLLPRPLPVIWDGPGNGRDYANSPAVSWVQPGQPAALTLSPGGSTNATARRYALPTGPTLGDAARAALSAALGESVRVEG